MTESSLLDIDILNVSDEDIRQAENERLDNDEQFEVTLTELEERFDDYEFTYKTYSGTVRQLLACPVFETYVRMGLDAATSWLMTHDGTKPDEAVVPESDAKSDLDSENTIETGGEVSDPSTKPEVTLSEVMTRTETEIKVEIVSQTTPPIAEAKTNGERTINRVAVEVSEPKERPVPKRTKVPEPTPIETIHTSEPVAADVIPESNEIEPVAYQYTEEMSEPEDDAVEEVLLTLFDEIPEVIVELRTEEVMEQHAEYLIDSVEQTEETENVAAVVAVEQNEPPAAQTEFDRERPPVVIAQDNETHFSNKDIILEPQFFYEPDVIEASPDIAPVASLLPDEQPVMPELEDILSFEQLELAVDERTLPPLDELIIEAFGSEPDEVERKIETPVLFYQSQQVYQAISVLEKARSAEDCRQGLEQIRMELATLLKQLGYQDAEGLAEQLTKSYDIQTLKQYMLLLLQTLQFAKKTEQIPRRAGAIATKSKHHYGAVAVRRVVELITGDILPREFLVA